MKYIEFQNIINEGTVGVYDVRQNDKYIYVYDTDGKEIVKINTNKRYDLSILSNLDKIAFGDIIWDKAVKLAETPLEDREEERKYNVIIANNDVADTDFPLVVWHKNSKEEYYTDCCYQEELKEDDYTFTESEYQDLLGYIKTLPNADKQLKIAEICKTLVEDD